MEDKIQALPVASSATPYNFLLGIIGQKTMVHVVRFSFEHTELCGVPIDRYAAIKGPCYLHHVNSRTRRTPWHRNPTFADGSQGDSYIERNKGGVYEY